MVKLGKVLSGKLQPATVIPEKGSTLSYWDFGTAEEAHGSNQRRRRDKIRRHLGAQDQEAGGGIRQPIRLVQFSLWQD